MPYPGETSADGQRVWQPTTRNQDAFNYLGANSGYQSFEDAQQADYASGEGSYVKATQGNQNGTPIWKFIAAMAAAGFGGQALASLAAGAGAGGGAAATGLGTGSSMVASTVAPTITTAAGTVLPAATLPAAASLVAPAIAHGAGFGGAAAGGSTAGSIAKLAVPMALKAAGGYFEGKAASNAQDKQIQAQKDISAAEIASRERLANQDAGLKEQTLDPFRNQMSQANDVRHLDILQNSKFSPVTLAPTARYAGSMPQRSGGGFSYEPDQTTRDAYGELKNSVMSGQAAPTMTNPANYGKGAWLDLLKLLAQRRGLPAPTA